MALCVTRGFGLLVLKSHAKADSKKRPFFWLFSQLEQTLVATLLVA